MSIASDAQRYVGSGYQFGGAPANGTGSWDCSSFVNWVIGHDLGMAIPGNAAGTFTGKSHGPVVIDWATWTGCTTVPGPPQNSDLCIWAGIGALGHMGIATDASHMVSALNHAQGTIASPIAGYGPAGVPVMYRRVNASSGPGLSIGTGILSGCLPLVGLSYQLSLLMPYIIRRNSNGTYRVTTLFGKVHMKSGSKADAEAQVRLLRGIDAGNGRRQSRRNRD